MQRRWTSPITPLLMMLALLTGCQLPDAGPFVDGTAQLRSAVAAGGAAVEQELRHQLDATESADELKKNWEARNKAMTAVMRYAQSLAAIVAAGNEGAASAGKVADAVKNLAAAADIAIPATSEAVELASDIGKFLYEQIARVRAAKQLAKALDQAQPAIERIAHLMRQDLADLDVIAQAVGSLEALETIGDEQNDVASHRKSLLKALRVPSANPAEDGSTASTIPASSWDDYARLTALLADVDVRYHAYQKQQAAIEARLNAIRAVIDGCGRALDEWAAAHAELASAARAKRAASARALIESAVELRDLVKRMRDL